jgi:hypothetical protein
MEDLLRPSGAPFAFLVTGGSQKALAPGYSRPALRASCDSPAHEIANRAES